ncbi:hypothetical protein Clacol_003110 [Clathrus columnatus]|uniref:Major facilitator superfamily (MFS) profile domain-containing protein n=1 Tax=Clathrus columnatus TaxID=1419009 RepID=A0AAV5AAD9_9AGAM|nr:hypothetical protein Clacol_003110 [Clathrus columnatus]
MELENESQNSTSSTSTETPEATSLKPPQLQPGDTGVSEKPPIDLEEFPEGGARAWAAVIGGFCLVFISQGAVYAFGVYQDYYTRVFLNEHNPSTIAWIGSMQLFLLFFLGLPVGKLFDEGYFNHLIGIGSVIYLFSYFMLSLAQPHSFYQVFLSQGVGVGLGMGMMYLPSVTLGFHYFKRRRGLAVGVASTGAAFGGILQTIGLNHLINGRVGFAWGVRIFGFIFLALAIIGNLLMRPRLPPRRLRPDQPKPDVQKIIRDVPLLLAISGSALLLFSAFFPYFYIQLFAILHGISTNLAFYSITIINAMTIIGRVISGILADRYGYVNSILLSTLLMGVISFLMIKATTAPGLIVFTILYGFFAGGYFSLAASAISAYVDNTNELGFALGYTLFIESFFVLIAQPIAGTIVDAPRYRWNRAIIAVSIILYGGWFASETETDKVLEGVIYEEFGCHSRIGFLSKMTPWEKTIQ